MLTIEQAVLVVIDVQGKLSGMMSDSRYLHRIKGLIKAAKLFAMPVVITEQAPAKIGRTIDEILTMVPEGVIIAKETFSCCGESRFIETIRRFGRKQIIICGIETHVCVYQTVRDLMAAGYEVYLVADAVSARGTVDHAVGLERSRQDGAALTTLEMTVTEIMKSTQHPQFRAVMALLKDNA